MSRGGSLASQYADSAVLPDIVFEKEHAVVLLKDKCVVADWLKVISGSEAKFNEEFLHLPQTNSTDEAIFLRICLLCGTKQANCQRQIANDVVS